MSFFCCVPKCSSDCRRDPEKNLSFHRFPKDTKQRQAWVVKIRREIGPFFQITGNTRVCSLHFKSECFFRTINGLRKLKDGTIPTEFSWTTSLPERPAPKRRKVECEEVAPRTTIEVEEVEHEAKVTPSCSRDHDYVEPPMPVEEAYKECLLQIEKLENQIGKLEQTRFFLERFSNDSKAILFYTGFQDYSTLKAFFLSLQPSAVNMLRWSQVQRKTEAKLSSVFRDESLPLIDQFFLFLCRVRQGCFEQDLAYRFNISQATVSRIIITWANFLYFMLGSLPIWCNKTTIEANMPQVFKEIYPKTRVIIDCTEIRVQTPSSKVLNSEMYSNYKSHTTFKSLIGISPFGTVSFISSLYTGCISDKEITKQSGFLDLLESGDEVMADKGFLITDLLKERNCTLVIPPFLGSKGKFSAKEVSETHKIARLRIHVERAIRRIKEYHIFDAVLPLSLAGTANQLWTVCALLTNFKGPLF